jgi:hypothetical protein
VVRSRQSKRSAPGGPILTFAFLLSGYFCEC